MAERVTADMLTGCGEVLRFAFKVLYPNGLTMEELAASDRQWLKIIYQHLKGVQNGNGHNR